MPNARSPILLALCDPALSARLAGAGGVHLIDSGCETLTDCLEQAGACSPAAVLFGPAIAPWPGALPTLAQALRSALPQVELAVLSQADDLSGACSQALRQTGVAVLLYASSPVETFQAWARGETTAGPPRLAQETTRQEPARRTPGAQVPPTQAAGQASAAPGPVQASPVQASLCDPPRGAQHQAEPAADRRVVAFWGGKPGAGRSTLITAVADVISRRGGARVCTVDLNLYNSSLATLLRRESEPNSWLSLSEALRGGSLTAQAVASGLVEVHPGWSLLTGPAGSDQWCGLLTPQVVTDLINVLSAAFDYILLDLPAGRTPAGDAALTAARQTLLVVSGFFPDVMDTTRQLDQAVAEGLLTRDSCRLVLSQWVDSPELPRGDVSKCLGLPVAAQVPLAPEAGLAAARAGRPATQLDTPEARRLAEGARAVAALIGEAGALRPQRRGWFGR